MRMLRLSSAMKGKIVSHYHSSGDVMYRLLFNQTILPRIQNSQQKMFCRCEPLSNFRKLQKFERSHFVPVLQCIKRKINTNSEHTAEKVRMEFLKMGSFVPKVS